MDWETNEALVTAQSELSGIPNKEDDFNMSEYTTLSTESKHLQFLIFVALETCGKKVLGSLKRFVYSIGYKLGLYKIRMIYHMAPNIGH